jgi:hypothetical protein
MSNADGSPLSGVPVDVRLEPGPGAACQESPSCRISSGSGWDGSCRLQLPCAGNFTLSACAQLLAGGVVCSRQALGLNASDWAAAPLQAWPTPQLFTDK